MATNDNNIKPKISSKFYCEFCYYNTCKSSNYYNHLKSIKHKNNELATNNNEIKLKLSSDTKYQCKNCEKKFNDRSGLWRHNKKCNINLQHNINSIEQNNENILDKDLVMMLIKQNTELMEILKNGTYNNCNNTTTYSHNKAFNLQFFLNETCKDAMNITDFVDSITLQLSDLEKVGEIGYVEGISNIIIKNLNNLEETKRPLHCTDKKRETIYIKDENKWEKEDEQNTRLRKVIRRVANKNIRLLSKFREKYPEYKNSSSKISDKYE